MIEVEISSRKALLIYKFGVEQLEKLTNIRTQNVTHIHTDQS